MNEMVERMAKAIFHARLLKGGPGATMMPWPYCPEADHCRLTARAAIQSMHEPTDAMLDAATEGDWDPLSVWKKMIVSALTE